MEEGTVVGVEMVWELGIKEEGRLWDGREVEGTVGDESIGAGEVVVEKGRGET